MIKKTNCQNDLNLNRVLCKNYFQEGTPSKVGIGCKMKENNKKIWLGKRLGLPTGANPRWPPILR